MYVTKERLFKNGKAKFMLIKDSSPLKGMRVFKALMQIYCKEGTKVKVFNFDDSPDVLQYGLDACNESINPLMMEFSSDLSPVTKEAKEPFPPANEVLDSFEKNTLFENPDYLSVESMEKELICFTGVACIHSLTTLIIANGVDSVYRLLLKVLYANPDINILALLHTDVHSPQDVKIIEKLTTTSIDVQDSILETIICFNTGRVKSYDYVYDISPNFEFMTLREAKMEEKKPSTKKPDPTANLTFNLRLKDEEKLARDDVQLPYMKTQDSMDVNVESVLEDDLYDEDDPDDDLDI